MSKIESEVPTTPWISVDERLPPPGVYVLTSRDSGYLGIPYEILTAQCNPSYKGWTDPSNTRLTDSGSDPTHWRPMLEGPVIKEKPITKDQAWDF